MTGTHETEIPKHYRPTFESNLVHQVGKVGSLLARHFVSDMAQGSGAAVIDQFNKTRAVEATDRFGDTPIMGTGRSRRWAFPRKLHWGDLFDDFDIVKTVIDPSSMLVQGAVFALGESLDIDILAPSFFGPAYEGVDEAVAVANPVTFPAGNVIPVTVGSADGSTDVGMNVAKIQAVIRLAKSKKVYRDRYGTPKMAITAKLWDDLFNEQRAIHGDYIAGRPLLSGDLPGLFQMDFVLFEELPTDDNGFLQVPVWWQGGMQKRDWKQRTVEIERAGDKQFNTRVYAKFIAGATRAQDELVYQVLCTS